MSFNFLPALPALIPVALLFWAILGEKKKRERESKHPFQEKLYRIPGEFAAKRGLEHLEKAESSLLGIILSSSLVFLLLAMESLDLVSTVIFLVSLFLFSAFFLYSLQSHYLRARTWRLGALGERVVGDQLMREFLPRGFKVYHDIQQTRGFDNRRFNYDHILLDHRGVFLIETKTRSKKIRDEAASLKISVSGDRINFPNDAYDTKIIPRLKQTAEELSESLSKHVETNVPVYPILVYPGWNVYRNSKAGSLPLCDSRDLLAQVLKYPEKTLNEKNLDRVVNWFEEIGRDIDKGQV